MKPVLSQGLTLAAGIIIGAVVSAVAQSVIPLQSASLILVTVIAVTLLVSVSIFFFDRIDRQASAAVKSITDSNDKLVKDLFEAKYTYYDDIEYVTGNYEGRVYSVMQKLIDSADSEILVLTNASVTDDNYKSRQLDIRKNYFREFENIIDRKSRERHFTYKRIFQLPATRCGVKFEDIFGTTMLRHCKKFLESPQAQQGQLDVSFRIINTSRLTGFIIIDKKILISIVGGVDNQRNPFHLGIIVFESNGSSKIIESYRTHFANLARNQISQELDTSLFSDNQPVWYQGQPHTIPPNGPSQS